MTTPNRSGPQLYTVNRHALALGTLVTDLLTLEFLLRLFLYETRSRREISFVRGQNLSGLRVGKVLPENAVTDYDSLGELICRFNVTAPKQTAGAKIAEDLVNLRNALAHGRLFVHKTGLSLQLVKFTKPHKRKVKVELAARLTLAWFAKQSACVRAEIEKVRAARNSGRRHRRV